MKVNIYDNIERIKQAIKTNCLIILINPELLIAKDQQKWKELLAKMPNSINNEFINDTDLVLLIGYTLDKPDTKELLNWIRSQLNDSKNIYFFNYNETIINSNNPFNINIINYSELISKYLVKKSLSISNDYEMAVFSFLNLLVSNEVVSTNNKMEDNKKQKVDKLAGIHYVRYCPTNDQNNPYIRIEGIINGKVVDYQHNFIMLKHYVNNDKPPINTIFNSLEKYRQIMKKDRHHDKEHYFIVNNKCIKNINKSVCYICLKKYDKENMNGFDVIINATFGYIKTNDFNLDVISNIEDAIYYINNNPKKVKGIVYYTYVLKHIDFTYSIIEYVKNEVDFRNKKIELVSLNIA